MRCNSKERVAIVQFLNNQRTNSGSRQRGRNAVREMVRRTQLDPADAAQRIASRLTPEQRRSPLVQRLLTVAANSLLAGSPAA